MGITKRYNKITNVYHCWPLCLGSVVFAPDEEHQHAGDEQEGHHQHRYWPNPDARGVISVEPPHAAAAGALPLPRPAPAPARPWGRGRPRGARSNIGRTSRWSGHPVSLSLVEVNQAIKAW